MRKLLLALFIACLMLAVPVLAQEDDENTCADVDLTGLKTLIPAIEAAFADGTPDVAGDLIDDAMEQLSDLSAACFPIDTLTYTAPDGSFSVEYPADLVVNEDDGFVVFGTSESAIEKFNASEPIFEPGEYGFGVVGSEFITSATGDPVQTLDDVIAVLTETLLDADKGFSVGTVENHGYNDRPGVIFDFAGPTFVGTILVVRLEEGKFLLFIAGANDLATIHATVEAIANSLTLETE